MIVAASLFLLSGAAATGADPVIIAHRGASGYLPEHTVPAIAMAHGLGADYIEQDVVLSRDGVPVVLHDIHIDTVTDVVRPSQIGRERMAATTASTSTSTS